jgi:uncharacterized protein
MEPAMATNEDVVGQFYERMHALDTDGVLAVLADDFVGHVAAGLPGGFGGTYHGAMRMVEEVWIPVYRQFGCIPYVERSYAAGRDTVLTIGHYRGVVPSTGREVEAAFAHEIRVRDGAIIELRQITDTCSWAAGLAER